MTYAIEIEDLHFTYPEGVKALDGVYMNVPEGSKVAIIGANGSGKTTLLLNIVGLLKGQGKILVYGLDPRKHFDKVKKLVGLVFQNPDDQIFNMTVYDEIAFTLRSMKIPEDEVRRQVLQIAKLLDIEHLLDRVTYSLSFGEKKRVCLASTLVHRPRIILLDEPTLGLDPVGKVEFTQLLLKLQQELNLTIVFTTHDIDIVPLVADYVYVMHRGKIVLEGTPEEVFTREEVLREVGLRPPVVTELFLKLKRVGVNIPRIPLTVEEAVKVLERLIEESVLVRLKAQSL